MTIARKLLVGALITLALSARSLASPQEYFGIHVTDGPLGEIWFATANSPKGPWREAKKIATHAMPKNNNDFNPIQHQDLQHQDGKIIYFESKFVNASSDKPAPTP